MPCAADHESHPSGVAGTAGPQRITGARLWRGVTSAPALALIALVRLYQWTLSPLLGPTCRFYPSCSEYWIRALRQYGLWRGVAKGVARLARCHPLHPGGYDPP